MNLRPGFNSAKADFGPSVTKSWLTGNKTTEYQIRGGGELKWYPRGYNMHGPELLFTRIRVITNSAGDVVSVTFIFESKQLFKGRFLEFLTIKPDAMKGPISPSAFLDALKKEEGLYVWKYTTNCSFIGRRFCKMKINIPTLGDVLM